MYLKIAYIRFIIFGTNPKTFEKIKKGINKMIVYLVNKLIEGSDNISTIPREIFSKKEFAQKYINIQIEKYTYYSSLDFEIEEFELIES